MPNINSLTYNGMKSTDLGVYVTGAGSFDAAEMDADKYEIAGRNGDLIIPKNRYKNIVVTYPAFIPKAFQEKAQSIRNWMRRAKAYARLEDTYDMEHYRLGLASGIQSFEPVNRNEASNFQLSFDCKPQRFLKTGETPLPIEPEAHSYSGEIVEFETVAVDDMTKAEVSLSPKQDGTPSIESGVNNAPYLFRPTGATAECNYETNKVVGGTVAWNQLVSSLTSTKTENGITYTNNGDGSMTLNGTADNTSVKHPALATTAPWYASHKYLIDFNNTSLAAFAIRVSSNNAFVFANNTSSLRYGANIGSPTSDAPNGGLVQRLTANSTLSFSNYKIYPQVFDLTQMFGSTIADYIYFLETANAGAGVAWFRKLFPKPYYAYNAGELLSVQTSAHKMVGFNAFDIENADLAQGLFDSKAPENTTNVATYEYTPIIGGLTYNFHSFVPTNGGRYIRYYDANKNYIAAKNIYNVYLDNLFTPPTETRYIRIMWFSNNGCSVADVMNGDICINLSWDGERDGEYEEYKQWVYPLDSDLVLRGIPKLSAGNDLYYDGDEYESDGTVTRRYGIVDLGTLDWIKEGAASSHPDWNNFFAAVPNAKGYRVLNGVTQVCTKYIPQTGSGAWKDKACGFGASSANINISDSSLSDYTTTEFKTAMSGVYLVYELAEPTTESADPYQNPQIVDDFGTEEYVDARDVAIPVGHVTQYGMQYAITGRTGASLKIGAEYPTADREYTSSFGQTVYGGTFDFVSGKLEVQWANIASYNGETITEPWLSSMDVYSAGATPTTGAQVVYKLATPIEIDLDPTEVQTLCGLNNVWASDGTVEINYADPFNVDNPTYFEARPLFEITNPAQGDVLNVNGNSVTFVEGYTGTVYIDCETMDCFDFANRNYLISATEFPVLNEGLNIVTWSGTGSCKMTPRWWEL